MEIPASTERPEVSVASARQGMLIGVSMVAIFGLMVSLGIWQLAVKAQQDDYALRLARASEQALANIQDTIEDHDEVLYGLRGVIVSDQNFSRQQFHDAVLGSGALSRLPGVKSLQYAIPVKADEGEQFEQRANSEKVKGVTLPPIRIQPPLKPGVNYVVDYVEPTAGNSQALGLNLSGLPGREAFIEAARRSGTLVNSAPFPLVLEQGEQIGYVAYLPVYDSATVPKTPSEREKAFRGLVNGVFVASDLLGEASVPGAVSYAIYDAGSVGEPNGVSAETFLFESAPGLDPAQAQSQADIVNGNRVWRVYFFAGAAPPAAWLPWLILVGSLLGTALLTLYVYTLGRARIEAQEVAADIAESERRFAEMSMVDPLTGLANRRSLYGQLEWLAGQVKRRAASLVVMFLDVDSFKSVNDVHGHGAGDALLAEVASRLEAAVRDQDVVGRLSGDEFCIAGLVGDEIDARTFVAQIDAALSPPFELGGVMLPVRASIGVVVTSDPPANVQAVLDSADDAMYEAKSRGGGEVVWFDDRIAERSAADLRRTQLIRRAIDDGHFELHYQPVIDANNGRVVSVEALLRLRTSDGLVPPSEFLDFAERTHLIRPLGLQVIKRAVRDRLEWQRSHPDSDLVVGINVSAVQAGDPATLRVFAEELRRSGLPGSAFCFELTETTMFGAGDVGRDFVEGAQQLGACLAMDDFGVGYSNLQALGQLDVDYLKIDRSLVQAAPLDPKMGEVIVSIAHIAPQFKVRLVAEGIETSEQLHTVREAGIDLVQGFMFARPQAGLERAVAGARGTTADLG